LQSSETNRLPAVHLNGFEWRIYHRAASAMAAQ